MSAPPTSFDLTDGHNTGNTSNQIKVVAGYALQQRLGSGSFAVVYKAVRLPQSPANKADTVAIKAIARSSEKLTKKVLQNLEIEISILRTYRHHNIVCLHDVQKTERHFYLVLEYCAGGDVQGLIRSRQTGRLSEILSRRLMRDLAAGLKFLWQQNLIHRDIKPQNLLLTGALPLDEVDDPSKTLQLEEQRRQENFPTQEFCLKIADFGFARHLQTASLAETLCGSPIYMAPEILQHQRYDAKADLWSVGTVLFEMITGKPPFHGENHIDLLRNIQRKAVSLPPGVRVSKEGVTLLRLLLNRNPLSRAGFKEFFEACDAFVKLGCRGVPTEDAGTCASPQSGSVLGTIPEADGAGAVPDASRSLVTVATHAPLPTIPPAVTPTFGSTPPSGMPAPLGRAPVSMGRQYALQPLVPSPPVSGSSYKPSAGLPEPPALSLNAPGQMQMIETTATRRATEKPMQDSSGDGSFVMVEHGSSYYTNSTRVPQSMELTQQAAQPRSQVPAGSAKGGYMVVKAPKLVSSKGLLSTSPGTGGALLGILSGGKARLMQSFQPAQQPQQQEQPQINNDRKLLEVQVAEVAKMLATAEDVGRRAISVAHLGDSRAYQAMKLIMMNESGSSLLSTTAPMDGIEEEAGDGDSGAVTDDSSSTEVMRVRRRRSSSATDKSMPDAKDVVDEVDEMPFAVQTETPPVVIPTRSSIMKGGSSSSARSTQPVKPTPASIRSYFDQALLCYVKTLKLLKSAIGACEKLQKEIDEMIRLVQNSPDRLNEIYKLKNRCEVARGWLSGQFRGVLERADAANLEIGKLQIPSSGSSSQAAPVSVEELVYNHALTYGREGAVKHLLGQFEAARACYRSAGLLAETLLMEPRLEGEDRKLLEGYVDGFAARINELDDNILQQSRAGSASSVSRRGPGVVSLVGSSQTGQPGFM